ncbi:hypothetical protein A6J63_022210 [Yersinia enterocolitica]|uniref:Uncharacterized protein n=1 Tax=Yersinia enterocolitica serotype O:8 / biotype 1B (strain NCTC 13174 / 8081) TaxID=393305 RepID=A1JL44_YERE8|nr:hypothetical protein A6J63_022210 [Yersinia enterocolitica]PNM19449.1 hypothetical protein A6J65_011600 [Yersinia enterocolitica]CAL11268.1 hypothetical protein YE1176 [Yersinia enterocolitica subsp. enterocolitica 8081]
MFSQVKKTSEYHDLLINMESGQISQRQDDYQNNGDSGPVYRETYTRAYIFHFVAVPACKITRNYVQTTNVTDPQ